MKTKVTTTLKELKSITNTYIAQLSIITKTIRDTYEEDINSIKDDLINRIANEYSLDASEIKNKFIKRKKKNILDDNANNDQDNSDSEYMPSLVNSGDSNKQLLLYKTNYDNNDYYIETIEGGKVYDCKKNEVGVLINGQMELNIGLITQLKNLEIQINDIQKDKNISVPNINNFKKDDDAFCSVIKKTPILIPISKSEIMIEPLNLQSNLTHNTVKSSDGINLKQNISNSQYQIEHLSTISPFRVECSPPKGGGTSPTSPDECLPPKNKQLLNNEIFLDKPPAKRINKRRNNPSKI